MAHQGACTIDTETYTHVDHRFRFAAWSAGRAAQRGVKGFTVEIGATALRKAGLDTLAKGIQALPDPDRFDRTHETWCESIREDLSPALDLSYGRTAKLVNTYLKALFLSDFGGPETDIDRISKTDAIHPPVDRLLLNSLARNKNCEHQEHWKQYSKRGWTRFCKGEYSDVIEKIRTKTDGQLWKIERYWNGHQ